MKLFDDDYISDSIFQYLLTIIFGAAVYDSIESDEEEHQKEALQGLRW